MPKPNDTRRGGWLYLLAMMFAASLVAGYGFRLLHQILNSTTPSLFSQMLSGLMVGFAVLIFYGYWVEYRAATARGPASVRPRSHVGCLLVLVCVIGFAVGLLVLAWKTFGL